jgi:hypothetical protein
MLINLNTLHIYYPDEKKHRYILEIGFSDQLFRKTSAGTLLQPSGILQGFFRVFSSLKKL